MEVVIKILVEERIEFGIKLEYSLTNNEAEYKALIVDLLTIELLGGKHLSICSDSQLVVGQVKGNFKARDQNARANALASKVSRSAKMFKGQRTIRSTGVTFEIQNVDKIEPEDW